MKKLRLDLEALRVVSFAAEGEERGGRGTVRAQSESDVPAPSGPSDYQVCTYDNSCQGICPIHPVTIPRW